MIALVRELGEEIPMVKGVYAEFIYLEACALEDLNQKDRALKLFNWVRQNNGNYRLTNQKIKYLENDK